MQTKSPSSFYISYFAKKHGTRITRKAQEPNPLGTAGRKFVDRYGVDRYIYWDLEARNKKTNELGDWRHATSQWSVKAI